MNDDATIDHVQRLQAQITGLEEDLRTARRALYDREALLVNDRYEAHIDRWSVTLVCRRCSIVNVIHTLDLDNGRFDPADLNDHIREHQHRYHHEDQ